VTAQNSADNATQQRRWFMVASFPKPSLSSVAAAVNKRRGTCCPQVEMSPFSHR
jgi:hypothetical protein